jgi:hypothetical protein
MQTRRSTRQLAWALVVLALAVVGAYAAGRGCAAASVPDVDIWPSR